MADAPQEGSTDLAQRIRESTERLRYATDAFEAGIRQFVLDHGVDPGVAAMIDHESMSLRVGRHFLLAADDRVFSFDVIKSGAGESVRLIGSCSDWNEITGSPSEHRISEAVAEGRRLLGGAVYFPPAMYSIAYPVESQRNETSAFGTLLAEERTDHIQVVAFDRIGSISWRRRFSEWMGADLPDSFVWRAVPFWITDPNAFAAEQARRERPRPQFRCPCCHHLTLIERGAFETCPVCCWEDDGQDDPHADEVWGGPNGRLSLARARANYQADGVVEPRHAWLVRAPYPEEV
jgi:hypothetical protein